MKWGNFSVSCVPSVYLMIWGNIRCQHLSWRSGSAVRSRAAGDRLHTHLQFLSKLSDSLLLNQNNVGVYGWALNRCTSSFSVVFPTNRNLVSPSSITMGMPFCCQINQDWNNDNFRSWGAHKDFGMFESFRTPIQWKWWDLYSRRLSPRLNVNLEATFKRHVHVFSCHSVFSESL